MGEQRISRTSGQSRGVDLVRAYYRQLEAQEQQVREVAPQTTLLGTAGQRRDPIAGREGGWRAHEEVLETVGQQDAAGAAGRRKWRSNDRPTGALQRIEGTAHRSIPEAPIGRGTRQGRKAQLLQDARLVHLPKVDTSVALPHRPMGASGAGQRSVVIA